MLAHVLLISGTLMENIGTIKTHVEALRSQFGENCIRIDYRKLPDYPIPYFDCLIFHYSVVLCSPNYFSDEQRKRISDFRGPKIAFIQDEYRFIDETVKAIKDFGINHVFTLVAQDTVCQVYYHSFLQEVTFETTFTGYVPSGWIYREAIPYKDREIDVSYRGRKLVSWLGRHTLQKWQIAEKFKNDVSKYNVNLKLDISTREEDRVYGDEWEKMLFSSKAVLGVESGASVCDFDGSIEKNVNDYLLLKPEATFEELSDRFFKDIDGKVTQKVISPRCFEAAAARTLMIMYRGYYNGVLPPNRHYVLLNEDHSNFEDVISILNDEQKATRIIEAAYNEIALNPKYQQEYFAKRTAQVVRELLRKKKYISIYSFIPIKIFKEYLLLVASKNYGLLVQEL